MPFSRLYIDQSIGKGDYPCPAQEAHMLCLKIGHQNNIRFHSLLNNDVVIN